MLFRNARLRQQGWAVLTVSWFEWRHETRVTKSEYLARKLSELLKQQRN